MSVNLKFTKRSCSHVLSAVLYVFLAAHTSVNPHYRCLDEIERKRVRHNKQNMETSLKGEKKSF